MDGQLQGLLRRWLETRSATDESRWLVARVRLGDLRSERLELAALLGHQAARSALVGPLAFVDEGRFVPNRLRTVATPPHPPLDDPFEALALNVVLVRRFMELVMDAGAPGFEDASALLASCALYARTRSNESASDVTERDTHALWVSLQRLPFPASLLGTALRWTTYDVIRPNRPPGGAAPLTVVMGTVFALVEFQDPTARAFLEAVRHRQVAVADAAGLDDGAVFEQLLLRELQERYVPRLLQYPPLEERQERASPRL